MTISIVSKFSKGKFLHHFEQNIIDVLFPHLQPSQATQIANHLKWMKEQKSDMDVACEFGTDPIDESTTVRFRITFKRQIVRAQ